MTVCQVLERLTRGAIVIGLNLISSLMENVRRGHGTPLSASRSAADPDNHPSGQRDENDAQGTRAENELSAQFVAVSFFRLRSRQLACFSPLVTAMSNLLDYAG
jgi:hypothetical protein